jgi:flavin-binding protein dodecin
MAKEKSSVYRVTELVGTSATSWEDAAANAVKTAARSLRELGVAEITKLDMMIEDGKVALYRARVSLSFKYEKSFGALRPAAARTHHGRRRSRGRASGLAPSLCDFDPWRNSP